MEKVRRKLKAADDGDRQMVSILTCAEYGLNAVEAACQEALDHGASSAAVILNILARSRDPEPGTILDADRLRVIIEGIFRTNRTVAKHTLVAIRKLLWVATDVEKWIKPQDDPSLSIRVRVPKSTKSPAWPIAIREKFEERHPIGTAARTCYALGFWLGTLRGDVAALEWDDLVTEEIELFDGSLVLIEAFDFRQNKNRNRHGGREMFIPVVDKLAAALEPLDRSKGGTVLKNAYGRSFSEKSLTGMMQHWPGRRKFLMATRSMGCAAHSAPISPNATSRRAPLWRRWGIPQFP